jgi:shikimate kinase
VGPVRPRMSRHRTQLIYLVGFMGSGKTTAGRLLADQLHWPFVDLDQTIEAGQGLSIRQIFEQSGEPFFRELEHAALTEASKSEPGIIALGGGTFVQPANVDFIRERGGTTVWLDCPFEELLRRSEGIETRPLFRDAASFRQLLEQRIPYYRLADFRVPSGSQAPERVVEQILRLELF